METMHTTNAHFSLDLASRLAAHNHGHQQAHFRKQSSSPLPPFRCSEPGCTRAFNRKYTLAEHQKTHSGEKPYACPVPACGKRFTTTGNLSRHRRLHGPVLPLQCPAPGCTCTFATDIKLAKHMKFHLGTAEHVCRVPGCGKTFSTVGNHNRHMRNQHNIYHDLCDGVSTPLRRSPTKRGRTTDSAESAASDSDAGAQSPSGADDDAWLFGWTNSDGKEDESESESESDASDIQGGVDDGAWFTACVAPVEPLTLDEAAQPWESEMLDVLSLLLQIDDGSASECDPAHK